MIGVRKKITGGFTALFLVLFFSGAISVAEMSRLRKNTRQVIESGTHNTQLAKRMLNALQMENNSVLKMVVTDGAAPEQDFYKGVYDFNVALLDATNTVGDRADLDAIYKANERYNDIIAKRSADSTALNDKDWFMNSYLEAYYALDVSIKDYMTSPQSSIAIRMSSLESNIYKTITPSIMTLIVAILIVVMFFFFLDIYYIKPLLKINRSLGLYLKSKVPYEVKIENQSELSDLSDNIVKLIEQRKENAEQK